MWEYEIDVPAKCGKCDDENTFVHFLKHKHFHRVFYNSLLLIAIGFIHFVMNVYFVVAMVGKIRNFVDWPAWVSLGINLFMFYGDKRFFEYMRILKGTHVRVRIPFLMKDVGLMERLMAAATVSERGSKLRPYGSFISMLSTYEGTDEVRTALLVWAPKCISDFVLNEKGVSRRPLPGQRKVTPDPVETRDADEGNADLGGSREMPGTSVPRDAYAADAKYQRSEECMNNAIVEICEPRILAHQVGPSVRNAECFETTSDNHAAAIDNRCQAPPFQASQSMINKINRVVEMLISEVFSRKKIKEWRVGKIDKDGNYECNAFEDMSSKKWNGARFDRAYDEAFADIHKGIEQEFMNKMNEVQDAGDKLPRPRLIIQSGDDAQVKMLLPVKCFEDLLFAYFKDASIKKGTKHEAMGRVAKVLNQKGNGKITTVEGDGSAWDACCNEQIRELTENRIMRHIVDVLGFDAEVPNGWMQQVIADLEKTKIKGKAKIIDFAMVKTRLTIKAIRQSGHRGTSCFNYLINLVNWLCVLCENPEDMIKKVWCGRKLGFRLPEKYISAYDGIEYKLRYAFEGDDSALTTTENLESEGRKADIIEKWTNNGFRMKLVFCKDKMTFTGFDFLVTDEGPIPVYFPEIKRNIASSAWTTSPEVRSDPRKVHRVAAAMFLARAENFIDFQPLCHYFAALGKAHVAKVNGSTEIGETEAMQLGIVPGEIVNRLDEVVSQSQPISKAHRRLMKAVVGNSVKEEKLAGLININIDDPYDAARAKHVLPKEFWEATGSLSPRPRGQVDRLLALCK